MTDTLDVLSVATAEWGKWLRCVSLINDIMCVRTGRRLAAGSLLPKELRKELLLGCDIFKNTPNMNLILRPTTELD